MNWVHRTPTLRHTAASSSSGSERRGNNNPPEANVSLGEGIMKRAGTAQAEPPTKEGVQGPPSSSSSPSSSSGAMAVRSDRQEQQQQQSSQSHKNSSSRTNYHKLFGARAMAAGGGGEAAAGGGGSAALAPFSSLGTSGSGRRGPGRMALAPGPGLPDALMGAPGVSSHHLTTHTPKYLVVGDGMMAPFMALCLRVHGLSCDLAYYPSLHPADRGTVLLTPSVTQLLGDVLNVSVPSGSVIGRLLTFDHAGNDMCDIDLNEFRERGESPTFYCCERPKVAAALLSLCRVGTHSCHVWSDTLLSGSPGGTFGAPAQQHPCSFEALDSGGVRVRFSQGSGLSQDYAAVICTARNPSLVPELTLSNEELQQRAANAEKYRECMAKAPRWIEMCVPPLPELKPFEKRFTPGSQEVVEIVTPREAKLTVRPTMLTTKLFYHVTMTIPDSTADPSLKSTSTKLFWDEVAAHWTAGVPGYISHTLFRPLFTHMQQCFRKQNILVYKTPLFLMPHWLEGEGRIIKIAHAAHGACFDAVDLNEAQGFTDCFHLARVLAESTAPTLTLSSSCATAAVPPPTPLLKEDVAAFVQQRRLQVMGELEHHARLLHYGLRERNQFSFLQARFGMKIMRRYKKSWSALLKNYVTLLPKK